MDPNIWGKHMWASIHFIALGYPDKPSESEKNNYKSFFENIYKVLPCNTCSNHLKTTLQTQLPLSVKSLSNKDNLFKWTVDLHNIVNARLNKPTITLDKATLTYMNRYSFFNAMCPSSSDKNSLLTNSLWCLYAILIIIIAILVYIYYNRTIILGNK
jgi:hypothetical protein